MLSEVPHDRDQENDSEETKPRRSLRCLAFGVALALLSSTAAAQPPDPALLERLSHHANAFEQIGKHASFRMEALTEELDGSGKVASTQTQQSRVEADGKRAREIVLRAVRDGKDVTAEQQEKVKSKEEGGLTVPFASDAYVYDQIGVDAANPMRVEISFIPKKRTKHTLEGTAWVDSVSGTILSGGAKLSQPPTFVDWVHLTVELGAMTPLGPAISHLTFEAKGGILFVRKHIRGDIRMSDYRWTP
jgi:hypothetical protein